MAGNREAEEQESSPVVEKTQKGESLSGKLKFQHMEDKLMHSVLEADKDIIDEGRMISDAINMSLSSFTPSEMFEQMVKDFSNAKQLYGPTMIREATGENTDDIERNIRIPEYQRELIKKLSERFESMREKKLLDKDYSITEKGVELASLVMYVEEIEKLQAAGSLGEKLKRKESHYGEKDDVRAYRKGDRYRDISIQQTVKTAIRRGHSFLSAEDLRVHGRQSKGRIDIIYALDASGSMKGKKLSSCKKAGIALAFRAIQEKDLVGLIIFGKDIEKEVPPTDDFGLLLKEMVTIRASQETDIAKTIRRAVEVFGPGDRTKHLILITDAMPTAGDNPQKETLDAAEEAARNMITISLVGINLDKKGEELAQKIVHVGSGRLYQAKDLDDLDTILIEDYYSL